MGQTGLHRFLVPAFCALFLLFCGVTATLYGGVYRSISAAADAHFETRTALFYLTCQVKSARDSGGTVALTAFGDGDALILSDPEGTYATTVYRHNGSLMELYSDPADNLTPDAGTALLAVGALEMAQTGDLLTFSLTGADGTKTAAEVSVK